MAEIRIIFERSRSKLYEKAIRLARQLQKQEEQGTVVVRPETLREDYKTLSRLWEIIKGWKGTRVEYEGKPAGPGFTHVLKCHRDYLECIVQRIYCKRTKQFPGWSCKNLLSVERHACLSSLNWDECLWWYQVGYFDGDGIWVVDKEEIAEILRKEADKKCLWFCPNFDWNKVQIHIDNLPGRIEVSDNEHWELHVLQEPGFPNRVVGVRPKVNEDIAKWREQ